MKKLMISLLMVAVAAVLFAAGGSEAPSESGIDPAVFDIKWDSPGSIYERVADDDTYVLPEGWEEAVEGTTELNFINSGPLQYDPAMAQGIEDFQEMTGITLNPIEMGEDLLHTKQSAMLRARSPRLDLVFTTISTEAYYDYQAAGWLLPCDFLLDDETRAVYPPNVLNAMEQNGQVFGFPYIGGAFIYGYRKDLFQEAGLSVPQDWDEMLAVAQTLTTDDRYGLAFPCGPSYDNFGTFCAFLSAAGGEVLQDGKAVLNSPEAVRALQFLVDLRNTYQVVPEGVNTYSLQQMGELFAADRIASFVSTTWTYQMIVNTPEMYDNFEMALYPAAEAGIDQTVYQDMSFYSVSPYSENQPAAFLFLDFLRSYQERKYELLNERNVIYNTNVWQDPEITEESVPFYETIREAVSSGKLYVFPNSQKIVDLLNVAVGKALVGELTPQEALDDVQEDVDILQTW